MSKRDQKPNNNVKFLAAKEKEEGSREAENCKDYLAKGILGTQKRRLLTLPWQIKEGFMEEVMLTLVLKESLHYCMGLCTTCGRR